MRYDFDEMIERRGTGSVKWDHAERYGRSGDLLPLWVADMDFRAPVPVIEALRRRVDHGIFGYTELWDGYLDAVAGWSESQWGWRPERDWVVTTPGVVYALATAVRALTRPGDAVLVQRPVYYPFMSVVQDNGCTLANAPLLYNRTTGRYTVDFDAFERVIVERGVRLLILSNPHNPVGRCWTRGELTRLGDICLAHGVIIVSDEIHADFVRPGHAHTPLASLSPRLAQASVTCTAASKTFNLAGLQTSNIVIPNDGLRERFVRASRANGYGQAGTLGMVATEAAYREGAEWLSQLKDYLEGNLALVRERLAVVPQLRLVEPEGTYLVWIDCLDLVRERGLDDRGFERFVEDEAGLWLDMGNMFGPEGSGFVRINIACPRATLARALDQLTDAVCNQG